MDQLAVEVEDRLEQPDGVAEELQLRLGLKVEVRCVPLGSSAALRRQGKTTDRQTMNAASDHCPGSCHAANSRARRAATGRLAGPTAGMASGYVQANLVILPADDAGDFAEFCRLNDRRLPAARSKPHPAIRSPASRLPAPTCAPTCRDIVCSIEAWPAQSEPTNIRELWRDDFVAFLLGCSFTFETALEAAGLLVRHLHEGANVPMYRTTSACRRQVASPARWWSACGPTGRSRSIRSLQSPAAIHTCTAARSTWAIPAALAIVDLQRPDFGDAVTIREGEMPVFWACGVTPQLAMAAAAPEIAITHSPGCMFVTDWKEETFCTT